MDAVPHLFKCPVVVEERIRPMGEFPFHAWTHTFHASWVTGRSFVRQIGHVLRPGSIVKVEAGRSLG